MSGLLWVVHEELKFAPIEPNAATVDAVIDLDICQFERNHGVSACGTIHSRTPDSSVVADYTSDYRFPNGHRMTPGSVKHRGIQ